MAQFIGKWKVDTTTFQNVDAFCKVAGLPDDMKERFKSTETTMEFKKNGDVWDYIMTYADPEMPDKTYTFRSGEEVVSESMGKGVKFTITFESDTKLKMVEYSEMMGWKPITNIREVKGNTMYIMNEIEGVQMHLQLNKCLL